MKTFLPSLKSNFDSNQNSHVVNDIKWSGCSFTYVGQTCQNLTTRIAEHQKNDSSEGQKVAECCGQSKAFEWRLFDKSNDVEKSLSLDAHHENKRKPQLNTGDEYKSREL